MVTLLENQGAIVARQKLGAAALDGLSAFVARDCRPYILLGTDKGTAVRWRFDASHELGHVLLHSQIARRQLQTPGEYKQIENQAHRFAAAFLLPLEPFSEDFFAATLDVLREMKKKWRVSIAMMLMRARDGDLISEETHKRLWVNYGRNHWKRQEPYDHEWPAEEPRLLRRAVELILQSGSQAPEDLVGRFGLSPTDIEGLVGLPSGYLAGDFAPVHMLDRRGHEAELPFPNHPPAEVIRLPYRPQAWSPPTHS
jgi:Zn-dependent peptidase ImmA (M78 family)